MSYPNVGYVYDAQMGKHYSYGHLERPERIYTIQNAISIAGLLPLLKQIKSRLCTDDELLLAHTKAYISKKNPLTNSKNNVDMYINDHTINAAKLAAGSTINLVNAIANGELESGFAIVRPPGHHAFANKCSGFCFYNNVAISAKAMSKLGKKVLIVDFDVHFGDATHDMVKAWNDPNIHYYSIHRWDDGDFYPGTGKSYISDKIILDGFNGCKGDDYYTNAFNNLFKPNALKYEPDIIIVSAGFDAACGDPLGACIVTSKGYYAMINILKEITPNIALVLEGGYSLESLATGSVACIQALLGLKLDISKVHGRYGDSDDM
jgi:histone deacetylase 4/5